MRTMALRFVAAAALLAVGAMTARAAGQSNRPANEEVLSALLTEVRGLRAAMEQMASAGPRIQLALGRLQLQEQRVTTMYMRLENVRDSIRADDRGVHFKELKAEEALLRQEIATEQSRWSEINQRLEELERALVRR